MKSARIQVMTLLFSAAFFFLFFVLRQELRNKQTKKRVTKDHLRKQWGDERPFEKCFWEWRSPIWENIRVTKSQLRKSKNPCLKRNFIWLPHWQRGKSSSLANYKFKQVKWNLFRLSKVPSNEKYDRATETQSKFYHCIWATQLA